MNFRYGVQFYVIIVVVDLQSNVKWKGNKVATRTQPVCFS